MMQVPDIESVEVGMSFSVMVNFLGLSLLVLFVPRLTTILSPNGPSAREARLLGQSNLLFLFRYVLLLPTLLNRNVLTNLYNGLNALAFVLVFFLVPSGTAQISLEEMNAICMDCSCLPLSCVCTDEWDSQYKDLCACI
jgi:hypothetical protein